MTKKLYQLIVCLIVISMFSSGCTKQVETNSPEDEIVVFVLDSIIDINNLRGTNLIVYGPIITTAQDVFYVSKETPYQVWWVIKDKLIYKGKSKDAVTQFYDIPDQGNIKTEIGFSIISINNNATVAKVYIEELCGPTCGTGNMYYLSRSASGKWEVDDQEELWIS